MKSKSLYNKFLILVICLISILTFKIEGQTLKQDNSGSVAIYNTLPDNEFLRQWSILGPIDNADFLPENNEQSTDNLAFVYEHQNLVNKKNNKLLPVSFRGKIYEWNLYNSENDEINLIGLFGNTTNVISYAYAEIESEDDKTSLWGLGSDDGVKIWINEEEIHNNNISRPVTNDDDIIELKLKKGINSILIKIQNGKGDYGFSLRPIGKEIISKQLINSAARGNLDELKKLMQFNPNLTAIDIHGLTAWQIAKIKGRKEIADYLKNNGADTTAPFPTFQDVLNNRYKQLTNRGITPGSAILLAEKGEIIYKKGFGYANVESKIPFTSLTKFRIGSVSKQFTASAILRLCEEGKIHLTDKLSKFIPDFPRGDEVTIHHLLTHTSGIHSYTNRPDFIDGVEKPTTSIEIIDIIKSEPYDFDPGTDYLYNNSGFYLLGYIVELITNKELGEYLSEEFFHPLGMKNTGVYNNEQNLPNEAIGYSYENDSFKLALNWDMSWAGGAGSLYSTVEDLFTWNEALFHNKVLKKETLKKGFTPVVLNNDSIPYNNKYGYGWSLNPYRNMNLISHGGGLSGFVCFLLRQPEEELTITVFTNCTPQYPYTNPQQVSMFLLEYLLWEQMSNQQSYSEINNLTPEQLKEYSGKYDYGMGMVLTVTLVDNQLFAEMSGQPRFKIYPMGEDVFYWKVVEARIEFSRNNEGQINGGIHYQNGQEIPVQKLPEIDE